MKNIEIASCYCFNPMCKKSIFQDGNDQAELYPLEEVLSAPICCKECNAELISKPTLEMQKQIYKAVLNVDMPERIIITNEQILTLI